MVEAEWLLNYTAEWAKLDRQLTAIEHSLRMNAFHYVYQPVSNSQVEISARVINVDDTDDWAKAGVMIRETVDANSAHAMVVLTPTTTNGAAFHRPIRNGTTIHVPFPTPVQPPFWVRVVRTLDGGAFAFSGFVSADGVAWQQIGREGHNGAKRPHRDGGDRPGLCRRVNRDTRRGRPARIVLGDPMPEM